MTLPVCTTRCKDSFVGIQRIRFGMKVLYQELCVCRLQPAVEPNAEDQEALTTVRGIWDIVQPGFLQQSDDKQRQQLWDELMPLLPELLPGLGLTGTPLPCCTGIRSAPNFYLYVQLHMRACWMLV